MTYQEFCKLAVAPLTEEEQRSEDETVATFQELQWCKGFAVLRAIRDKRDGNPTREDLDLIRKKTNIIVVAANYRRASAGSW